MRITLVVMRYLTKSVAPLALAMCNTVFPSMSGTFTLSGSCSINRFNNSSLQ